MQFISISQRRSGFSDEACEALRDEEARRVRELYSVGLLRQIWHRGDLHGACLLWEAESEEQVREMLGTLPFARAKMLEIEIIPLVPYRAFASAPAVREFAVEQVP